MKPHKILKAFTGSQTGLDFQSFAEGTTELLSDDLAAIAVFEGWAEAAEMKPRKLAPGEKLAEADLPEDSEAEAGDPVDLRETKVISPEEKKPAKPAAKKR